MHPFRFVPVFGVLIVGLPFFATGGAARGQAVSVFNNTSSAWTAAGSWTPSGVPGATGVALFSTLGTAGSALNHPVLSGSASLGQLRLGNTATGAGWELGGGGALTAGNSSLSGLVTRGVGTTVIGLGDGSSNSLILSGPTTATVGAVNLGSGTSLVLTGNTVASVTGHIWNRGGTLILDNATGDPAGPRLTITNGTFHMFGSGATYEFRGAAPGSSFSYTSALGTTSGSGTVQIVQPQNVNGGTTVTFGSLAHANEFATVNFTASGPGTLGGGGASDPRIRFNTAPGLTNGVIANGTNNTTLGWALYNGTDFAGYNSTFGVIPVVSSNVSGNLTSGTNINITGSATTAVGITTFTTIKISPSGAGQSLTLGGALNSVAFLLAGNEDYSINGGSITGGAGRILHVVNPSTTLHTNSTISGTNDLVKAGEGFVVFTGNTNQFSSSGVNVNLNAGTLRVTSTNFSMTSNAPVLRFRGGVMEYDVSGGAFVFSRNLGTANGSVNWNTGVNSTNAGGGGFSAYAGAGAGNGNTLTVNLGNGATLSWDSTANFIQDGYALKFGSLKSNATVVWQNPLNLDPGSGTLPLFREIHVTRGVGNAADRTRMSGVIAGLPTTDLVKTGTGVLEFAAGVTHTYAGNTQVAGGTLLVNGSVVPATGSGSVFVHPAGTLGGAGVLGSAGNKVNVFVAGTLAPGDGPGVLTVNGNLTFAAGATYAAELGGAYDQTVVNGTVILNDATLALTLADGFAPANGDQLFLVVNDNADAVGGTFLGIAQDGVVTLGGGYTALLSYTGDSIGGATTGGNDVVLYNFLAVPEVSSYALMALGLLGAGACARLRRGGATQDPPPGGEGSCSNG